MLRVRDEVSARRPLAQASRLHLHPDCEVVLEDARRVRVAHPGGAFRIAFAGPGELSVEPSRYFPEFGLSLANCALVFRSPGPATTGFCIADGDAPLEFDLDAGARVGDTSFSD